MTRWARVVFSIVPLLGAVSYGRDAFAVECSPSVHPVDTFEAAMRREKEAANDLERSSAPLFAALDAVDQAVLALRNDESRANDETEQHALADTLQRLLDDSWPHNWSGTTSPAIGEVEARGKALIARKVQNLEALSASLLRVTSELDKLRPNTLPVIADLVRLQSEIKTVEGDSMKDGYVHLEGCFARCSPGPEGAKSLTELRALKASFDEQVAKQMEAQFKPAFKTLTTLRDEASALAKRLRNEGPRFQNAMATPPIENLKRAIQELEDARAHGSGWYVYWGNNRIQEAIGRLRSSTGYQANTLPPTADGAIAAFLHPTVARIAEVRAHATDIIAGERQVFGRFTQIVADYRAGYVPGCRAD